MRPRNAVVKLVVGACADPLPLTRPQSILYFCFSVFYFAAMEGEPVEQRLLSAIEASDAEAVKAALSQPGKVNWTHDDGFGQGLLNRAAEMGDLEIIALILQSIPADSLQDVRCVQWLGSHLHQCINDS